jgi:Pvc16 N-terminal domain
VEILKITPVYLSTEELSKMWTAMQARYRPTMAYLVSVVLIQGDTPLTVAPPVLQRGVGMVSPAPPPYLTAIAPAASSMLPAMRLGDNLVLTGAHFKSATSMALNFVNTVEQITSTAAAPTLVSDTQLSAQVPSIAENPSAMSQWAIGTYSVSLTVTTADSSPWSTNTVPISLSPLITVAPLNTAPGTVNLTVTCTPRLLPDQEPGTLLVFGSQTVPAATITTPADPTQPTSLTFSIPSVAAGTYLIRLRVEGIDSLPLTIQNAKFAFDPNQQVVVA